MNEEKLAPQIYHTSIDKSTGVIMKLLKEIRIFFQFMTGHYPPHHRRLSIQDRMSMAHDGGCLQAGWW